MATGIEPSFFEVAAAALLAFAARQPTPCILEVGLGGRLDATNIVARPLVTGIASIGLDHQAYLGDTLGEIAAEKAAIAKRGVPLVVAAPSRAEAEARDRALPMRRRARRVLLESRDWQHRPELVPALPGPHQLRNANLAWAMLRPSTDRRLAR